VRVFPRSTVQPSQRMTSCTRGAATRTTAWEGEC
jgi:hypothetical protein